MSEPDRTPPASPGSPPPGSRGTGRAPGPSELPFPGLPGEEESEAARRLVEALRAFGSVIKENHRREERRRREQKQKRKASEEPPGGPPRRGGGPRRQEGQALEEALRERALREGGWTPEGSQAARFEALVALGKARRLGRAVTRAAEKALGKWERQALDAARSAVGRAQVRLRAVRQGKGAPLFPPKVLKDGEAKEEKQKRRRRPLSARLRRSCAADLIAAGGTDPREAPFFQVDQGEAALRALSSYGKLLAEKEMLACAESENGHGEEARALRESIEEKGGERAARERAVVAYGGLSPEAKARLGENPLSAEVQAGLEGARRELGRARRVRSEIESGYIRPFGEGLRLRADGLEALHQAGEGAPEKETERGALREPPEKLLGRYGELIAERDLLAAASRGGKEFEAERERVRTSAEAKGDPLEVKIAAIRAFGSLPERRRKALAGGPGADMENPPARRAKVAAGAMQVRSEINRAKERAEDIENGYVALDRGPGESGPSEPKLGTTAEVALRAGEERDHGGGGYDVRRGPSFGPEAEAAIRNAPDLRDYFLEAKSATPGKRSGGRREQKEGPLPESAADFFDVETESEQQQQQSREGAPGSREAGPSGSEVSESDPSESDVSGSALGAESKTGLSKEEHVGKVASLAEKLKRARELGEKERQTRREIGRKKKRLRELSGGEGEKESAADAETLRKEIREAGKRLGKTKKQRQALGPEETLKAMVGARKKLFEHDFPEAGFEATVALVEGASRARRASAAARKASQDAPKALKAHARRLAREHDLPAGAVAPETEAASPSKEIESEERGLGEGLAR